MCMQCIITIFDNNLENYSNYVRDLTVYCNLPKGRKFESIIKLIVIAGTSWDPLDGHRGSAMERGYPLYPHLIEYLSYWMFIILRSIFI